MPIIELKKVCKNFGGLQAVHNVDLLVEEHEILGLIGPNGAGKTTLFNMIACTYPPTSGQIHYEGHMLKNLKPHQACDIGIARTFQVTKPFGDLTCIENIMVGAFHKNRNAKQVRRQAEELFDTMDFAADMNQSALNMTTGDRKKLEVARALATNPRLLLLDEVMAGCNPFEKQELCQLVRKLREKGLTVIVIEHDIKTIMTLCDRIVVLHRGEKLVEGAPELVANDKKAISAYLGEEYKGA